VVLRAQPSRRLLIPLVLAITLACETAGVAAAMLERTGAQTSGSGTPTLAIAATGVGTASTIATSAESAPTAAPAEKHSMRRAAIAAVLGARRDDQGHARPGRNHGAVARPEIVAQAGSAVAEKPRPVKASGPRSGSAAAPVAHRGRNHVWIPSLGIDRSVASFPCARKEPPGNHVYRWGCAGRNNVYLMGHAWSVFKPLHDVFVRGRLRKGMIVDYADSRGTVRRYAVVWWKLTAPTAAAAWAWAPLSRPSMTLQTCVGAHNEMRLMVRLVATH
jgi:hypothetical protein